MAAGAARARHARRHAFGLRPGRWRATASRSIPAGRSRISSISTRRPGEVSISKVPSTPDDPSRAILQGVEMLLAKGVAAADIGFFCHGTTVGTNALLEGKGVKTGLLVTEGFRGIYPVGEQARPYGAAIFDVMYDKPAMLVPQSLHRRGEGARRPSGRRAARARRGGAAGNPARARRARDRVDRGLPVVLVPPSAARGAGARDRARGAARLQHLALLRDRAADPRVSPALHHGDQRLSAADPGALHRPARSPPDRRPASAPGRNTSCSRTAAWRPSRPRPARR